MKLRRDAMNNPFVEFADEVADTKNRLPPATRLDSPPSLSRNLIQE